MTAIQYCFSIHKIQGTCKNIIDCNKDFLLKNTINFLSVKLLLFPQAI